MSDEEDSDVHLLPPSHESYQ